jgi:hypothetical protein
MRLFKHLNKLQLITKISILVQNFIFKKEKKENKKKDKNKKKCLFRTRE